MVIGQQAPVGISNFSKQLNFIKFPENQPFTRYQKSEMLFFPEDKVTFLYYVQRGRVKVGTYDEEGNEQVFRYLRKGDWLGERVLFGQKKQDSFAEVMEDDTIIYKVRVEPFLYVLQNMPMLGKRILEYLNNSQQRMEQELSILRMKDLREKIWAYLEFLVERQGKRTHKGILVAHGLTQTELADLVGTSRKTISLTLNSFQEEGLIILGRGKFWKKE